jgi:hypothetical protein
LIGRNARRAFRIRVSQFRIGQQSFQRAVTRVFYPANHFHFTRIQWQEINVFEIIIVIRFAHRREVHHLRHSFLDLIGKAVNRDQRGIARFDEILMLVRRKIDIQRHQAVFFF